MFASESHLSFSEQNPQWIVMAISMTTYVLTNPLYDPGVVLQCVVFLPKTPRVNYMFRSHRSGQLGIDDIPLYRVLRHGLLK